MSIRHALHASSIFGALAVVGCSAAPTESSSSSRSSAVSGACAIGGGQCLVGVQNFFNRFGITVGVAGAADYDDEGRYCETYGACHIWVDDVPSHYGWSRTQDPSANDIAVFPPHPGNPYGHITIVEHVDAGGVWMIDTNDNNDEVANNTPHLHYTAPYGYYHYGSPPASLESCGGSSAPSGGGGTNGSCAGLNDGLYCGSDYVRGDANTLYRCSGGQSYVEENCDQGCISNPSGANDACGANANPPPPPPAAPAPTGSCSGFYDGLYCGSDYVNGDADTLYRCSGGSISVEQACASGCEVNSDGTNDRCR